MKPTLNEQFTRMQKIAGIINESQTNEGYDEFQRADKGSKDVTAKDKGEEEVYGAGVEKGEEIEKKKMKESELRAKIKEMIVAEMALDIDTMENAPESEVDFLAELEGMLGEESPMNDPRTQQVIDMLIDMEVDGETMEYILRKVGMEGQMANQLVNNPAEYAASLSEAKEEEEEIEVTDEFSSEEEGEGGITVSQNADADLTGNKKQVQDNLEAALEAAKTLGDEKLATQIGNSLTFFTKQHVVKENKLKNQINEELYPSDKILELIEMYVDNFFDDGMTAEAALTKIDNILSGKLDGYDKAFLKGEEDEY